MPHTHAWNFRSNKRSKAIESNFYDKELVLSIQQERRLYDGLTSLVYTHVRNSQHEEYLKMYFQLKRIEVEIISFAVGDEMLEMQEVGAIQCEYVLLEMTYIHPNFMPHETNLFTEETGHEYNKYGNLTSQMALCDKMGTVCVGVVQEAKNSWSLRENVQLLSFDSIAAIFPSIKQLESSNPSTYLKQCTASPGYFKFIGIFEWNEKLEINIILHAKFHHFPEGELWLAYELFYENLSTGLVSKMPIISKDDGAHLQGVKSLNLRNGDLCVSATDTIRGYN